MTTMTTTGCEKAAQHFEAAQAELQSILAWATAMEGMVLEEILESTIDAKRTLQAFASARKFDQAQAAEREAQQGGDVCIPM